MALQLIYANPSPRKRRKKAAATSTPRRKRAAATGAPMARKKRTRRRVHARAATPNPRKRRRYRAATHNPRKRRRVHRNPTVHRRRARRNPSSGESGSVFKEFMSKDGLIKIAAGLAGATVPVLVQSRFMPSLTGYTKTAARAAVGVAGAWVLHKFVSRKAGNAFALTALVSAASEAINTWQANSIVQPVSAAQQAVADRMAENPGLMDDFMSLNGGYDMVPMSGGYDMVPMADEWDSLN